MNQNQIRVKVGTGKTRVKVRVVETAPPPPPHRRGHPGVPVPVPVPCALPVLSCRALARAVRGEDPRGAAGSTAPSSTWVSVRDSKGAPREGVRVSALVVGLVRLMVMVMVRVKAGLGLRLNVKEGGGHG